MRAIDIRSIEPIRIFAKTIRVSDETYGLDLF